MNYKMILLLCCTITISSLNYAEITVQNNTKDTIKATGFHEHIRLTKEPGHEWETYAGPSATLQQSIQLEPGEKDAIYRGGKIGQVTIETVKLAPENKEYGPVNIIVGGERNGKMLEVNRQSASYTYDITYK